MAVSPEEVAVKTLRNLRDKSRAFIRFTGGEPTLQWREVTEVLRELRAAIAVPKPPILFQTNGIEIGKGVAELEELTRDPHQNYLFELSLKGTNSIEFELLTGKSPALYEQQLKGYEKLLDIAYGRPNIAVVAVLGVYHSSTKGPSRYVFVNPDSGKILFDDPENWDPRFSDLWLSASLKWVEPLRMSPMGVWKNVLKRCGPTGARVVSYFPAGTPTNVQKLFPAKPRSREYARQMIQRTFWR